MWSRSFIFEIYQKYIKQIIFLQITLIILLFIIVGLTQRSITGCVIEESSLSGGHISEEGFACIDEGDGVYGTILEVGIQGVKKGWYKIRITYETGYDDNGFFVQAFPAADAINEDIGNKDRPVALKSYHESQEIHVWAHKDTDLRIGVNFCGGGYLTIKGIELRQVPDFTPGFLIAFVLIVCNVELWERMKLSKEQRKRKRYVRFGIAFIVIAGSIPLMNDFAIHGHDYRFHLYRIEGIAEGILAGQFPVKILPNWWNEFGYGTSMFYGDFFLYFPALLILVGYSLQTAYKCYIVFINLLTAWIAYKCFWKISKEAAISLLGALLYSLNPYRLIDIYVRCAIGEYTALAFLPLILLGIFLIEENGWLYLALGLTGCIQSHMLTCEMIAFFLVVFCLIKIKWLCQKRIILNFCKAGIVAALWNLWFIVPFLNVYRGDYQLYQLFFVPDLQEQGIVPSEIFKLYFQGFREEVYTIGGALIFGMISSAILLFINRKKLPLEQTKITGLTGMSIILSLYALLLSTNLIPYGKIAVIGGTLEKLISALQFPWRFMSMASVLTIAAIIGGLSIEKRNEKKGKYISYIMGGLLSFFTLIGMLVSYYKLLTEDPPYVKNYEYYAIGYIMEATEYLPAGTNEWEVSHDLLTSGTEIQIEQFEKQYTNITMTCINGGQTEGYVDVPLFFYPCYKAKDVETGEILPLIYGENNRIRIMLPSGYQGTLTLKVSERKLWRLAEAVSLISALVSVYVLVSKRKRLMLFPVTQIATKAKG